MWIVEPQSVLLLYLLSCIILKLLKMCDSVIEGQRSSTVYDERVALRTSTVKRRAQNGHEFGAMGLPPEKMALIREKKEDIEKVRH